MGKKSGPPAPDYTKAAEAQGQSSKENITQQTWANRADQTNPWGSTNWQANKTIDPATGQPVTQWTENTTLDPGLQGALNSQIAMQQGRSDLANSLMPRAQQEFGQAMDWSGLSPWAGGAQAGQLNPMTSAWGGGLRPTTSAFSFGGPRAQGIDTSRAGTPQLDTNLGANAGAIQGGLNFGGVQDVAGSAAQRQRAENAIYQSATSRLDPQWDQRQQTMETDLANRGITGNSEAYTRAMADFNRQRTDAYEQANMGAITGAGAEAQRDYGMDLGLRQQQVGEIGQQGQFANAAQAQEFGQGLQAGQANNAALGQGFQFGQSARDQQLAAQQALFQQQQGAGQYGLGQQAQAFGQQQAAQQLGLQQQQQAFGQQQAAGGQNFNQQMAQAQFQNQLRNQQLTEAMQQRGFSLNEINAIMSGQQVGMPQFQGYNQAAAADPTNYMGAAEQQYGAAVNSQNAANAARGNTMSALGSVAMAAMMFSDRRVKRIERRIGTHPRGFGIYRFRYIGERGSRVGVIAQEVRRVAPELVRSMRGVLQVDYGRI
jgi:hypothetical protein